MQQSEGPRQVLFQGYVGLVKEAKVIFRQRYRFLLALGLLLRLLREVDIEVRLERLNRGELHKLRGVLAGSNLLNLDPQEVTVQ